MSKVFWQFIENSKGGKAYISSEEQASRMTKILEGLSLVDLRHLEHQYHQVRNSFNRRELSNCQQSQGGFISAQDSPVMLDFADWLVAQGYDFVTAFNKNGAKVAIDHVREGKFSEADYLYQNMMYPILKMVDKRSTEGLQLAPRDHFYPSADKVSFLIHLSNQPVGCVRLVLGDGTLAGLRFTYAVARKSRNSDMVPWELDVPVSLIPAQILNRFLMLDLRAEVLLPSGDLLLSRKEQVQGVNALAIDTQGAAHVIFHHYMTYFGNARMEYLQGQRRG